MIYFYIVHSISWMLLLNMPVVPENKTLFIYLYIMCICNVYLCSYFLIIMTKIFIFTHFGPKYPPFFFIFCDLERLCLYNREISLAILLRQNSKTNMTKNRDKIMKYWYIFAISLTPTWNWPVLWPHLHKLHWNHLPKFHLCGNIAKCVNSH